MSWYFQCTLTVSLVALELGGGCAELAFELGFVGVLASDGTFFLMKRDNFDVSMMLCSCVCDNDENMLDGRLKPCLLRKALTARGEGCVSTSAALSKSIVSDSKSKLSTSPRTAITTGSLGTSVGISTAEIFTNESVVFVAVDATESVSRTLEALLRASAMSRSWRCIRSCSRCSCSSICSISRRLAGSCAKLGGTNSVKYLRLAMYRK